MAERLPKAEALTVFDAMLRTEGSHVRHKFIKMAVIDTWEQVMFNLHVETASE
jgi:hypothetical protein